MKLSEKTISVLKNFATINPSIEFREGNILKTVSPTNTILASIELDEEFPRSFPIYEVTRLLGTLSLFKDPDLSFTDKEVLISDGKMKSSYKYCGSASMFNTPPDKDIPFPEPDVSFTLTHETLKKVMNAANVLSLPMVAVVGDGSIMSIEAMDSTNDSSDTFSAELGETDKTFRLIFRTENLKLMEGDYDVMMSSKYISHFKRTSDGLQYWIALETSSTFEK